MMIDIDEIENPPLMLNIDIECEGAQWASDAIIETGSPISVIKRNVVPPHLTVTPVNSKLSGINKSPLKVLGVINTTVFVKDISSNLNVLFYVVDNGTIYCDCAY